jgi:predicted nucleic acid-binding protein
MNEMYFIDSNLWLYLLLADNNNKYIATKTFLEDKISRRQIVISWQVINEVSVNLLKNKFSENEVVLITKWLLKIADMQDFNENILLFASSLRQNHSFSFWDSLIISAALEANCNFIASEYMQHNQFITKRLKIIKPFIC